MHGKSLLFTLFFILHYFQCLCNSREASEYRTLWKIWLNVFLLLAMCLQVKNQCDPVNLPGDICDQRILQSNWLKAFLVITQEQESS